MFYDRFEELRKSKGISLAEVAKANGFDRTNVYKWRDNGSAPQQELLVKIANYFNVSVDYLLEKTDIKSPQGEKINDDDLKFALFGEIADQIPDSKLDEVKNFADYIKKQYKKE